MASQEELREQFKIFEKGDGIETQNLGMVLRALGLNPTQATVEQYAKNFESQRTISFEAFFPVYESIRSKREEGSKEDFIEGLRVFDKDGRGQISVAELRSVLTGLGERLRDDEVDLLLKNLEGNNSGMINYENFVNMVMNG